MSWNPYSQCSWPPEDEHIESFTAHVRDQAKAIIGSDLARSEKFTTSVMDGLDIRETLRHWHTGDIYVKIIPPSRGTIEVVVFLFEQEPDPGARGEQAIRGCVVGIDGDRFIERRERVRVIVVVAKVEPARPQGSDLVPTGLPRGRRRMGREFCRLPDEHRGHGHRAQ